MTRQQRRPEQGLNVGPGQFSAHVYCFICKVIVRFNYGTQLFLLVNWLQCASLTNDRRHVRWGPSSPSPIETQPPSLGPSWLWPFAFRVRYFFSGDYKQYSHLVVHVQTKRMAAAKPASIARAANRHRSRNRPKHPKSLDFELNTEHVPADFVRADIQHTGTRHLLFASAEQLELLSKAKTW